jgi:protein CMS1
VGTPQRLQDLVENGMVLYQPQINRVHSLINQSIGSLSLENLQRLVVDASHIDQKKRGILDMKEITMPLVRWLSRSDLKERYVSEEKPLHLLFY